MRSSSCIEKQERKTFFSEEAQERLSLLVGSTEKDPFFVKQAMQKRFLALRTRKGSRGIAEEQLACVRKSGREDSQFEEKKEEQIPIKLFLTEETGKEDFPFLRKQDREYSWFEEAQKRSTGAAREKHACLRKPRRKAFLFSCKEGKALPLW